MKKAMKQTRLFPGVVLEGQSSREQQSQTVHQNADACVYIYSFLVCKLYYKHSKIGNIHLSFVFSTLHCEYNFIFVMYALYKSFYNTFSYVLNAKDLIFC